MATKLALDYLNKFKAFSPAKQALTLTGALAGSCIAFSFIRYCYGKLRYPTLPRFILPGG